MKKRSYTQKEDTFNMLTHLLGSVMATYLFYLVTRKENFDENIVAMLSYLFYGSTVILMLIVSSIYHGSRKQSLRNIFRRLDHATIFLLILATYAPIIFLQIKTSFSYYLFFFLAVFTFIGIIFKLVFSSKFKNFLTLVFIAMGWCALLLLPAILQSGNLGLVCYLVLGGLSYTFGAYFYIKSYKMYYHVYWHLFVLGGIFFHYIGILLYV